MEKYLLKTPGKHLTLENTFSIQNNMHDNNNENKTVMNNALAHNDLINLDYNDEDDNYETGIQMFSNNYIGEMYMNEGKVKEIDVNDKNINGNKKENIDNLYDVSINTIKETNISINKKISRNDDFSILNKNSTENLKNQNSSDFDNKVTNTHIIKLVEEKIAIEQNKINLFLKAKVRQEYEDQIKAQLKKDLRKKVEKDIYDREYETIKKDVQVRFQIEMQNELQTFKVNQLTDLSNRFNNFISYSNIEEILEQEISSKLEKEMQMILNRKEKDLRATYLKRKDAYDKNIKSDIDKEYKKKNKELQDDIKEAKSSLFRMQCSEKLKMQKISEIKEEIKKKEDTKIYQVEKIEKNIIKNQNNYNHKSGHSALNTPLNKINNKSILVKEEYKKEPLIHQHYTQITDFDDENKVATTINHINDIENQEREVNQFGIYLMNLENQNQNLNQKEKKNLSINQINLNIKKIDCQDKPIKSNSKSLFKITKTDNILDITTTEKFSISKNDKDKEKRIIQREIKNELLNENFSIDKSHQNGKTFLFKDSQSLKFKLEGNLNFENFGNKISKHISNEENYKMLFNKEIKILKRKLKEIFLNSGKSDHCLTDFMIEQWEKLEVAYENRYKILSQLTRLYDFILEIQMRFI